MLQNFVFDQLPPPGSVFQQDGALPHYHKEVSDFLDANFPNRWIGRGGPLAWSARSPDLTTLDFFWGFAKVAVYQRDRANTLEELSQRITNTAALVSPQMLRNTSWEVEYRSDVCRVIQYADIELHGLFSEAQCVYIGM